MLDEKRLDFAVLAAERTTAAGLSLDAAIKPMASKKARRSAIF
jgi:hypothetical protein